MTKSQQTLFRFEEKILERAQAVLSDEQYRNNPMHAEFAALTDSYRKMLIQFCHLIRLSDSQQMRLNELNQQLAESNASKDKFFSIISHDLRSPLSAIIGFSDMLETQIKDNNIEEIRESVQIIHKAALSLYELLENLLTWSRLQIGAMEWQPEEIELSLSAKYTMDIFLSQAAAKKIDLKMTVPQGTKVYADVNMTHTVLRNLISNAVKFTPRGGTIEISAKPYDAELYEITVSDTGVGIPPEHLPKLCRIDVRHVTVGTAGERGTGLGLNLCKEFVKKNGGTLWVESCPGRGTAVRFTLPRIKTPERLNTILTPETIAALPEELRSGMHSAAQEMDFDRCMYFIEQLYLYNPSIADILADAINNYRFDAVQEVFNTL